MTSKRDVEALVQAQTRLTNQARVELAKILTQYQHLPPDELRDVMARAVPGLVEKYGKGISMIASDWYKAMHPGGYSPVVAQGANLSHVERSVRALAGVLFGEDGPPVVDAIVSRFGGMMQRYIADQARETILENGLRDPKRPRFARVPSGAKTCAFCMMLAARGFAYPSAASAGSRRKFHDDCDCQIVPSWDKSPKIDGYNHRQHEFMYEKAVSEAGSSEPEAVTAAMRRLYPDAVTDGHVHKDS